MGASPTQEWSIKIISHTASEGQLKQAIIATLMANLEKGRDMGLLDKSNNQETQIIMNIRMGNL